MIAKLALPTCVHEVRFFFRYVGFYLRFIKDFSKISRPLCNFLVNDQPPLLFYRTTSCFSLAFEITSDALDYVINATISKVG